MMADIFFVLYTVRYRGMLGGCATLMVFEYLCMVTPREQHEFYLYRHGVVSHTYRGALHEHGNVPPCDAMADLRSLDPVRFVSTIRVPKARM